MASLGYDPGLSEKDQKKLRKKQKKLDKHANKALRADQRLAEVLLNNKICVNGGTVRFEDMKRVKRREDDEY
jgi:spermidine/putrescine-binding protein